MGDLRTVVITGSTRGIGFGLADACLQFGCQVVVSGRGESSVNDAVQKLAARHLPERIFGQSCDVRQFDQMQALWDVAHEHFGKIDLWINNAGISHAQMKFWDYPPEKVAAVVETNLNGVIYGSIVAVRGMRDQGFGSLYNMEGLGSDGRWLAGLSLYGTTKYGLRYFNKALVKETKDTPIIVGWLAPGMVVTDLLIGEFEGRPEDLERNKRIFNILAEKVETVAPWMAQKILANKKSGVHISYLTQGRMIVRFLTAPFQKRDLFAE
jgi:NAD(P)-dependent dehydrogenase (short-subunit alcohol dehydrogenase family)